MRIVSLTALAFLIPATALAAKPEADSCAASLPAEARSIYAVVSPSVTPQVDLRALVREKVTAMVLGGEVSQSTARTSAYAAGKCLLMLQ